MSGGSLNYLYNAEVPEILLRTIEMEIVESVLHDMGYDDIASEVRTLRHFCEDAAARISYLHNRLNDVLHDVEWYESADIGKETLLRSLSNHRLKYRPIDWRSENKKESE